MDNGIRHKLFNLNSFMLAHNKMNQNIDSPEEQLALIPAMIFLRAFIFELIIKMFYELDKGMSAPTNHFIDKLFTDLNVTTQELIKKEFNDKVMASYKVAVNLIKEDLYEPKFEEILTNNVDLVINFKYSPVLNNGSLLNIDYLVALREEIKRRML